MTHVIVPPSHADRTRVLRTAVNEAALALADEAN